MVKPVAWEFTETPTLEVWQWDTPHFNARIVAQKKGQQARYSWRVADKTRGREIALDASESSSFQEATDAVLELIGKSYPSKLGYQAYAGPLATTFVVASGARVDFAPIVGMSVILKAIEEDGSDRVIIGSLRIQNYMIQVRVGEEQLISIPPHRIRDIQAESTGQSFFTVPSESKIKQSSTKGRIFYTEYQRGCTGRPGFRAGTVEHSPSDPYCPIHNV